MIDAFLPFKINVIPKENFTSKFDPNAQSLRFAA